MFCTNKINVHVSLETLCSSGKSVIPGYFRFSFLVMFLKRLS